MTSVAISRGLPAPGMAASALLRRRRRRGRAARLWLGMIVAVGCGAPQSETQRFDEGRAPSLLQGDGLRLMTLNMYVGANLELLHGMPRAEIPSGVASLWASIADSGPADRAAVMAAAITRLAPDVVALQEAALIRRQTPGDFLAGNATPAGEVAWDFLQLLVDALERQGLTYRAAAVQLNADVEVPLFDGARGLVDVRLTDRDALLVRDGLRFDSPRGVPYEHVLQVAGTNIVRGFVSLDLSYQGATYRLVNTHLEAVEDERNTRLLQAQELVESLAAERGPVILLGDFNADPPADLTYRLLLQAGFEDLWSTARGEDRGPTCCRPDQVEADETLRRRIDLILARGLAVTEVEAVTALDTDAERTRTGRWPTDHAAVAVRIRP